MGSNRLVNDTFAGIDISAGASVYQYTATRTTALRIQVFLDTVVGGATDYIAWLQKQRLGAGASYPMLPRTTGTGIAGWTDLAFVSIQVDVVVGDVIDIYVDGQPADNAVGGKVEIFEEAYIFPAGAIEFTYTVTDVGTGFPIEGVQVWITTDVAGANVIWSGVTDAFGVARDAQLRLPWLDAGTYQFWSQRTGYSFTSPDAEVVS